MLLFVAVGSGGCDGEPELPTLTRAAVTGLPAGDAVGAVFSGSYVSSTESIDGCRCRVGSCASFLPATGETLVAVQQGGALMFSGDDVPPLAGGVYQDGAFSCGGFVEEAGDVEYVLLEGSFALTSDQPTSFQGFFEKTVATEVNGGPVDCDLQVSATFAFAGP